MNRTTFAPLWAIILCPGVAVAATPAESAPADATTTPVETVTETGPGSDVCSRISCSGHGKCVVLEGKPSCACDPEYQPDERSGLNCIPSESAVPRSVSAQSAADASPETTPSNPEEDLAKVKAALPEDTYQHERDFVAYKGLINTRRFHGSYIDYKIQRIGSRKVGGISMIVSGSVLAAGFFPFLGAGIAWGTYYEYDYARDEEYRAFDAAEAMILIGPGLVFLAAGTAVLVVGAVRMSRTKKMLEAVFPLVRKAPSPGKLSRFSITPFYDKPSATYGIAGVARF